ncbi:MAG: NUDIX domain-containing protein [Calditrichaeota bacterium]|nr:MAG: NUDIX domain-containing protein [Calditrichota bacterium]MBL1204106.1 NUDIX domain-containing protein [Calditrichota bacterium]NOG43937.1 NUDIX hydrolase [Calditrichota bacterium]
MKYCSNCGNRVSLKIPEGDTHARFVCDNCHVIHYQNPRMVVGCLPIWDDKILICKRAIEPKYGLWTLPAGFMENGETVEEGALRETLEESGAEVKIERLHSLYSLPQANQVYAIYLANMTSAYFDPGTESLECKLITVDQIPWDEIAFTAIKFSLKKYVENLTLKSKSTFLGRLNK